MRRRKPRSTSNDKIFTYTTLFRSPSSSSREKEFYNPKAFFTHAAWLDQGCPHCPIFPTAASRRSLGRVSVPVWLIILSDQLRIVALVRRYHTNKLIRRGLLPECPEPKSEAFPPSVTSGAYAVLAAVSSGCPPLQGKFPRVTHPSATGRTPKDPSRSTCMC